MRIHRLDLTRYGKFTDKTVSLPPSDQDFHLIVGPNEAGKSTLRNAIQDLLFGIETRSRYNFLHHYNDMRLGALIGQGHHQLEFFRVKGNKNTLRTPEGGTLPDTALAPFLGSVDRGFFDQMFGLNHERLIKGGQEILSASNDIGQILFQAAAGIGSLGEVRDRLVAEAGQLWAKRRSNDREYYQASDEFEAAETALKQATVRTKDWQAARQRVDELSAAIGEAQVRYHGLEQERVRLERVRRIAPILATLQDQERQLAELGEVVALPEEASQQLAEAEQDIARATQALQVFEKQIAELEVQRDALHPDPALLARALDIEALTAGRQQLRNHERDIGRREEEVRMLWQTVQEAARQLGWPEETEASLSKWLPGHLVRSAIDELLRRHEALSLTLANAEEVIRGREGELQTLETDLAALPGTDLPEDLQEALAAARALGDVAAQRQRLESQVARLAREQEQLTLELGQWQPGLKALGKLVLPTREETAELIQRRSGLIGNAAKLAERAAETRAESAALQLEITQYRAAHRPVTLADVQRQRAERDSTWQAIKAGTRALGEAATGYEQQVAEADALSDQRHDKAQEETELQSRLDRLQRQQQQLAELDARALQEQRLLTDLEQGWDQQMQALGLPGMPLLRIESWRAARERVLQAATTLREAQISRDDFLRGVSGAMTALAEVLQSIEPDAARPELPALLRRAEQILESAHTARERRKALVTQQTRARAVLNEARNRREEARQTLAAWQQELRKNLALAHLPPDATLGTVRGALGLFEDMSRQLEKIRELRVNRIDLMRRDLADFAAAARSLAEYFDPSLSEQPAEQIALTLESRLKQAIADEQDRTRLTHSLEMTKGEAQTARHRIAAAEGSLQPLAQRMPNPLDQDALREAIGRSDRHRHLTCRRDELLEQLLREGDGLDRITLEAELSGAEVQGIPARLLDIRNEIDGLVGQQNQWSSERSIAETALHQIAGQDDAARAESRRQEALARMGNAVERYIRVHTAAKLLRWSIERFRESKQGPMLARAGDIFRGLTAGALQKLVVDYDSSPLTLSGQRAGGALVGIDGMSEGTRDQLYLALRLAALELHLEQTAPLPFIADDLFINYDDARAEAGFAALSTLAGLTQVIFLSHHDHLVPVARAVFGERLNVVNLGA